MDSMTARQPRRTRRRISEPRTTLLRPTAGDAALHSTAPAPSRAPARHREHHVTDDFSHVTRDLRLVTVVGAIALAFVVVMSFVVN